MIRERLSAALGVIRRVPEMWRRTGLAVLGAVICEVGARIMAPNINGRILGDFIHQGEGGFLRLYDLLTGGALGRGGVLALGIMPYVSARIWVRVARLVSPQLDAMWMRESGRAKITRFTRVLTVGLALIQSYGFVRLIESVPGIVTRPGAGFVLQTMALLTAGAVSMMWIGEQITARHDSDVPVADEIDETIREEAPDVRAPELEAPVRGELLLEPGNFPAADVFTARPDPVGIRREPAP